MFQIIESLKTACIYLEKSETQLRIRQVNLTEGQEETVKELVAELDNPEEVEKVETTWARLVEKDQAIRHQIWLRQFTDRD